MSDSSNRFLYNQWSEFYDSYSNPTVAIDELYLPRHYETWLGIRVLEIGCGTGRHTRRLVSQDNEVVGVDISEGMLNKAKEKITSSQFAAVHGDFISKRETLLPQYDAILSALVFEHLPDLEAAFRASFDLLKPGGKMVLSNIHAERTAGGIVAHFKDPKSDQEFQLESYAHRSDDFEDAAHRAGFTAIDREVVVGDQALAALNEKWRKHLGKPMLEIWSLRK